MFTQSYRKTTSSPRATSEFSTKSTSFMFNKYKWQNVFYQIAKKVEMYESMPIETASKYYSNLQTMHVNCQKTYKKVYTNIEKITTKVVVAYN